LVEVNQKIPYRDEAKLRLAAQGGEPSAPSRVFDERPLRWAPLTSLPARDATSVRGTAKKRMKKDENTLDSAADVIHGMWHYDQKVESDNYPIAARNVPLTLLLK
jgi:hypothetical protein